MAELEALRAAKQAIDEGLISTHDYDFVKVAFLRAQQLKAGLDAGFIKQEDYVLARDAYLGALDLGAMGGLSAGVPPAASTRGAACAPPAAAAPPQQQHQPAAAARPRGPSGAASSADLSVPTDVPQYAAKGSTVGKCSMAGIGLAEDCVNLFMHLKTRSAYKWMTFKVDDSGKTVVPDKVAAKGSTYEEFVAALPPNECRYAVFDYEYVSPERGIFSKIVFVNWAPDTAAIKAKMMYASTKDFFKGFLDGIGAELHATDDSELSEEEIRSRVTANITRKRDRP
ncbi:MAG: actin-depolymerizing factor AdfA [Monoraphidium minutum]|nr:MAG: actin-depolymerizing factor AdfA [Monoraphidium minutum]